MTESSPIGSPHDSSFSLITERRRRTGIFLPRHLKQILPRQMRGAIFKKHVHL